MTAAERRAARIAFGRDEGLKAALNAILQPRGTDIEHLLNVATRFVTPRIAALATCLGERYIRSLCIQGKVKSYKLGDEDQSRILIELSSLEDYITRNPTKGTDK